MKIARKPLRVLLVSALFLTLAPLAAPAAIAWEGSAWRTADGRLYFGSAPPPGSIQTTEIRLEKPRATGLRIAKLETPIREPERSVPSRPHIEPTAAPNAVTAVAPPKPRPTRAIVEGIAFVAPPRTVGEGENRALTTCVRNHGHATRRVWMAGPERILVGVIAPGGIECLAVPAPTLPFGPDDFWLEAAPDDEEGTRPVALSHAAR